jgi:hypothetical protein
MPRLMPGHRLTGAVGFVEEDADGGPPVALKNGGAPQRVACVPTAKLGCAVMESPARPGVIVMTMKEVTAESED